MMDCRFTVPRTVQISRHRKAGISALNAYVPDSTGCQPCRESPCIDLPAAPKPKPRPKQYTSKDVELLLHEACKKLVTVQRERYVMGLKVRMEGCLNGKSLSELEMLEWYHFSGCPKKYL